MLELRRWSELELYAKPLQNSEHEGFSLFAMARAAFALDDTSRAGQLYRQATKLDPDLVDEQFEAALEPAEPVRIPVDEAVNRWGFSHTMGRGLHSAT